MGTTDYTNAHAYFGFYVRYFNNTHFEPEARAATS